MKSEVMKIKGITRLWRKRIENEKPPPIEYCEYSIKCKENNNSKKELDLEIQVTKTLFFK
jgi:hypothetical protein